MKECLSTEEWLRYQQGEGSSEERGQRQAHLVACDACQEELQRLGFWLAAATTVRETVPGAAGTDCPPPETLRAYVERHLTAARRSSLREHLQACPRCLGQAAELQMIRQQAATARQWRFPRWLRTRLHARFAAAGPAAPRRIRWTLPQLGLSHAAVAAMAVVLVLVLHRPAPPGLLKGPGGTHAGPTYGKDGTALWGAVREQAGSLSSAALEQGLDQAETVAEKCFYLSLLLEYYDRTGATAAAATVRARLRQELE